MPRILKRNLDTKKNQQKFDEAKYFGQLNAKNLCKQKIYVLHKQDIIFFKMVNL